MSALKLKWLKPDILTSQEEQLKSSPDPLTNTKFGIRTCRALEL